MGEAHSKRELDNLDIEMRNEKRNIITRVINATSVAEKVTLLEIAKLRRWKVILLHSTQ